MIEWKQFDPKTAADEIEENQYLVWVNERIFSATHDAMNKYFYYTCEEGYTIIPYQIIENYAEINYPGEG